MVCRRKVDLASASVEGAPVDPDVSSLPDSSIIPRGIRVDDFDLIGGDGVSSALGVLEDRGGVLVPMFRGSGPEID